MMTTPEQLAAMLRDMLHDRLENSTTETLAFEAASLRAFMFSTLDSIDHIREHVQHDEITNKTQMLAVLDHLVERITYSMVNLEDTRIELQHRAAEQEQ